MEPAAGSKKVELNIRLETEDLYELIKRYHLQGEDLEELQRLNNAIMKVISCKACYQITGFSGIGIVTLGSEIDRLQESCTSREMLYEALLIDYLSTELLNQAYHQLNEICHEESGYFVKNYLFPGAELPIEEIEAICIESGQDILAYNQAYMLIPGKSAVFRIMLTEQREKSFCSVCHSCRKKDCPMRTGLTGDERTSRLNYGYQKIFGHSGMES